MHAGLRRLGDLLLRYIALDLFSNRFLELFLHILPLQARPLCRRLSNEAVVLPPMSLQLLIVLFVRPVSIRKVPLEGVPWTAGVEAVCLWC